VRTEIEYLPRHRTIDSADLTQDESPDDSGERADAA
jgi:hypothetical protein